MSDSLDEWNQPTLFVVVSPARMYRWPDGAKGWLESGADCGLSSTELLSAISRDGLLSKMSPVYYPPTEDLISGSSFAGWRNAGMASVGGYWTLNISESPSAAAACSLSAVLEAETAPKYFLSPKACQGILRRAAKRGKELPPFLQAALEQVAQREQPAS